MNQKTDNAIELICSVSELANLFLHGQDIRGFLSQVVKIVSSHMQADVCSIFLLNEKHDALVLQATEGLNKDMVGKLTLAPGEGLTGLTLKELRPIREGRGSDSPYYKHIPDIGEEHLESFLAVPIMRGVHRVGVLVLQDEQGSRFSKSDALTLKAIASQLAATLENAQILITLPDMKEKSAPTFTSNRLIRGTQVVEGVAIGQVYHLEESGGFSSLISASDEGYGETLESFHRAINQTEHQLEELQNRLEEELADVASLIFSAHLLMLRDGEFSGAMEQLIREGNRPSDAVVQVANNYITLFATSNNPRLREKILDIKDLGHRILKNLVDVVGDHGDYDGQIVVTKELLPSEFLKLAAQHVEGLVLFGGGVTAHISVLARSLYVPLIFTDDESIFRIPPNSSVALDAFQGLLIVNPDDTALKRLTQVKINTDRMKNYDGEVQPQTYTADGKRVYLRGTVNLLTDLKLAKKFKAEGIGLYRSEFPFLIRSDFPTEEEQYHVYKQVIECFDNSLVTFRTLDIGGDKILGYLPESQESNPFLGLRGIRFLLEHMKVFVGQLKAMIRAAENRQIRILFPLISSVDDFTNAKKAVLESISILKKEGFGQYPVPKLGAMIELPSAVELAPELAKETDFLSLGTNDLVQYTLGVDRTNEKVASLFDIRHPAVFRTVKRVSDAAKHAKCPLTVCGIMSKNPATVYYMIGLGIREFSMEPVKIPEMQNYISTVNHQSARKDATILTKLGTLKEIQTYMKKISLQ